MPDATEYVEQLSSRISILDVFVGSRRRKDYGDIEGMAKDMRENGQITAITVRPPSEEDLSDPEYKNEPWVLVAGGRRMAAAMVNGWTTIRAVDREHMDPLKHRVLELAENLLRKEMTFVEIAQAKQEMYLLRKQQNPEITQAEVAKEIGETAANFSRDLRVAEVLEQRPELKQASSKKAVIRQAQMAEHFEAKLEREKVSGGNLMLELSDRLVTADARDWLRTLPDASVDLHIPDLPYGIDHFSQGHKMRSPTMDSAGISEYDDSEEVSKDLFVDIVPEMIRTTKETGWIICFMSEANYEFLKSLFEDCCLTHFQYRDETTGDKHCLGCRSNDATYDCKFGKVEEPRWFWHRPNSQNNPRYPELHAKNVIEHLLIFNRGSGRLYRPCDNVLVYDAEYGSRIHAMQKPIELLKDLISRVTFAGETVVDCCFGSGSGLAAAAELMRDFKGCEKNPALRGPALGYVSEHYQGVAPRPSEAGTREYLEEKLGEINEDEIDMAALEELEA